MKVSATPPLPYDSWSEPLGSPLIHMLSLILCLSQKHSDERLWLLQVFQTIRHSPRCLLHLPSLFHFHSRQKWNPPYMSPIQGTTATESHGGLRLLWTPQVTTYPHCTELNSENQYDLPGDFVSFSWVRSLTPALPFGSHVALAFFFSLLSFLWFVYSSSPFWKRILSNYQQSKHHYNSSFCGFGCFSF